MTIRDYQLIKTLDTGSTTYEYDLATYFKIDTTKDNEYVVNELNKVLKIDDYEIKEGFYLNGKEYIIQKDLLDNSYDQWVRMELILSKNDNLDNIHKLISIYCRPTVRNWYGKKIIEPFILLKQDDIAEGLLDLDISIADALLVFFYQSVPTFMNNITVHYLNLMNYQLNSIIRKQLTKSGTTSDGV